MKVKINFITKSPNKWVLSMACILILLLLTPEILAQSRKTVKRKSSSQANKSSWVLGSKRDEMTDEIIRFAYADSIQPSKAARLQIFCLNQGLYINILWDDILLQDIYDFKRDSQAAVLLMRWDAQKPYKMIWGFRDDEDSILALETITAPYTAQGAHLIKNMLLPISALDFPKAYKNRDAEVFYDMEEFFGRILNHKTLRIRAYKLNGAPHDVLFNISGANAITGKSMPCLSGQKVRNIENTASNPQTNVRQLIKDVRVSFRSSLLDPRTKVMLFRNNSKKNVSFRLKCYTTRGNFKTFNISVMARGTSELGFVQGWDGNFISGEYCEAYHRNEKLWTARVP